MAIQHFYSRMPAKLTLYIRTDGYDTFYKSSGINKEYIDENLSSICKWTPSKQELALMRDSKLPPTYCQYFSNDNKDMIQSCFSYIPLDFTGERSSFMIHSLILTENERKKVTMSLKNGILNPEMFVSDLKELNVTKVNSDYKMVDYQLTKIYNLEEFATLYYPEVFKRLLYAILIGATNKGKTIFISLEGDISEFSNKALDFINTILLVFPFNFRNQLSFITYLSDPSKFANIKIKFVTKECLNSSSAKGYKFDMTPKIIDGIRDEEYKNKEDEINFLYSLFSNKQIREKFLNFYSNIVSSSEESGKNNYYIPDLKDFSGILKLFKVSSGFYNVFEVIKTEEDVYDLFSVYERFRNYMKVNDRCNIVSVIKRYSDNRIAIPKKIFSKICKLYPKEVHKSKQTIMTIILDLIHTDAMREKLFNFIEANYENETPKSKAIISEDLSRVFYGGFLQKNLMEFFDKNYSFESVQTRTIVLEKFLLSIRNIEVQNSIFEFLKKYYYLFDEKQKQKIYSNFNEMISEVDDLTLKVLNFINEHIILEEEEFKTKVLEKIAKLIENDEKRKEKRLLSIVLNIQGVIRNNIINLIFTLWCNRNAYVSYLDIITNYDNEVFNYEIKNIFTILNGGNENAIEGLINKIKIRIQEYDIYQLISFDEGLLKNDNTDFSKKIYLKLKHEVISKLILNRLEDAYDYSKNSNGLYIVLDYVKKYKDNDYIMENPVYFSINNLCLFIQEAKKHNINKMINLMLSINCIDEYKEDIIEILKCHLNLEEEKNYNVDFDKEIPLAVTIRAFYSYLSKSEIDLEDVYKNIFEKKKEALKSVNQGGKKQTNNDSEAACWAFEQIINYCMIAKSIAFKDNTKENLFRSNNSKLVQLLPLVIEKVDKKGYFIISEKIFSLKEKDNNVYLVLDEEIKKYRKKFHYSIFSRVFKK